MNFNLTVKEMASPEEAGRKSRKVHYSNKIESVSRTNKGHPTILKPSRLWLQKTTSYIPEINQLFVPPNQTYTSPIDQYVTYSGIVS